MSRIGRKTILIPSTVTVDITADKVVVKGPKGELAMTYRPEVRVIKEGSEINLKLETRSKTNNALWGLTRALINNMIVGVTEGYEKKLELVGVGYRAKTTGKGISMSLGYSHPVDFDAPAGIKIDVAENVNLSVSGIDKQLVGQVAAKIRALRSPEPYKGKGIRYVGEQVRRKVGKTGKA